MFEDEYESNRTDKRINAIKYARRNRDIKAKLRGIKYRNTDELCGEEFGIENNSILYS